MSSMTKGILLLIAGLVLGGGGAFLAMRHGGAGSADMAAPAAAPKRLYTCAMHPHILRNEPGNCPVCGMRLTPVANPDAKPAMDMAATDPAVQSERKILYWRAPMDPNFVSDQPGKSPMGMDLVPVYEDQVPSGGSIVHVEPNFLQNFAVRTAVAERGTIPLEIRTVGILAHDEASVHSVNTKFEGWIEKSYHNNIGEHVHEGTPLFEIYSP